MPNELSLEQRAEKRAELLYLRYSSNLNSLIFLARQVEELRDASKSCYLQLLHSDNLSEYAQEAKDLAYKVLAKTEVL